MIFVKCPDCNWFMDCEDEQDAADMLALHELFTIKLRQTIPNEQINMVKLFDTAECLYISAVIDYGVNSRTGSRYARISAKNSVTGRFETYDQDLRNLEVMP